MRRKTKTQCIKIAARAAYWRTMGEYDKARIQYQRLMLKCMTLATFGIVSADEWFNAFTK